MHCKLQEAGDSRPFHSGVWYTLAAQNTFMEDEVQSTSFAKSDFPNNH